MTTERLILSLLCLFLPFFGLQAQRYQLEVVEGPTATKHWVPLVLNQNGSIAGNAYFFEGDGTRSMPIYWPSLQEPTLVAAPRSQDARVRAINDKDQLLCEVGTYGCERWTLWDTEKGWQILHIPNGYTCQIQGMDEKGYPYGTYRKRRSAAIEGALFYPHPDKPDFVELKKPLLRHGHYGLIHSILPGGNDTLTVNFSHTDTLNEDFFLWHPGQNSLDLPPLAETARIVLCSNRLGAVCGCEYAEEWGTRCRHFYWSNELGLIYLEPDLPAGIPDTPELTVFEMNDRGEVVGAMRSQARENSRHAFVWTQTQGLQDLNQMLTTGSDKDVLLEAAVCINQNGTILVRGRRISTRQKTFCVLYPVQ